MLSWKRNVAECGIWGLSRMAAWGERPAAPESIFLLQPSHIGDLLVDTPLFAALRRLYPQTHLVVGTGAWNFETLKNNPHISELVEVNCPWNNTFISPRGLVPAMKFIYGSKSLARLRERKFSMGIDLIGTQFDALILMRLGIPYRIGVYGPGGGHTSFHHSVVYDEYEPMARTALRMAELLGADELPPIEPEIFLTDQEKQRGKALWGEARAHGGGERRIVVGPAASVGVKCWPWGNFKELIESLAKMNEVQVVLVGGNDVLEAAAEMAKVSPRICNLAGKLKLRETFGLVAASELVISNSNMLMHVAAAFNLPAVVVLGGLYESAKQHRLQWGYASSTVLGKELGEGRSELYRPDEVLEVARGILAARAGLASTPAGR